MRIIILGGPCCGKSTLASSYHIPIYCSDPKSTVRHPQDDVTYLPEGLDWSAGSDFIARNWLTLPPPWCCEGVGMVRALRKFIQQGNLQLLNGAQIIHLTKPYHLLTPKQEAMAKAVETIWKEVNNLWKEELNAQVTHNFRH